MNRKDERQRALEELQGDEQLLNEFMRFRDKQKQKQIRKEIELKTRDLLENDLARENEAALEVLNKVYRKAWSKACKEMGYDEDEFPSRY